MNDVWWVAPLAGLVGAMLSVVAKWLPACMAHEEREFVAQSTTEQHVPVPAPALRDFFRQHRWFSLDTGFMAAACAGCAWAVGEGYGLAAHGVGLLLFCGILLLLALIDIRTQLLPDALTKPLLWAGLLVQLVPSAQTVTLEASVLGAVCGYVPLLLISLGFAFLRKKEGLGYGDVKLMAAVGAWLGPIGVVVSILVGACLAVLWQVAATLRHRSKASEPFPFGPWLVTGALAALFARLY